jgi:hypothetical protein
VLQKKAIYVVLRKKYMKQPNTTRPHQEMFSLLKKGKSCLGFKKRVH